MASAALLSITLVPVLMGYLIRAGSGRGNPVNRFSSVYRPVIDLAVRRPWSVILVATRSGRHGTALAPAGSEFMPPLHEGSILFMPTTVPGVSIAQARDIMRYQDSILASFPEVERVLGKAVAPPPPRSRPTRHVRDNHHPQARKQWRAGMTYERLVSVMDRSVGMPGHQRLDHAHQGPDRHARHRGANGVGIKIFGPDLDTLQALGEQVERIMQQVPGTRSAFAERGVSGYYVDIDVNRSEAARYGLNVGDIHNAIMATSGGSVPHSPSRAANATPSSPLPARTA